MQSFAMSPAIVPIEERVAECLNRFGDAVMSAGRGRWWITQPGDGAARTMVAVDRDWLLVEQTLLDCRLTRIDAVQGWGARLLDAALDPPSGARPVLSAEDNLPRMRAEHYLLPRPSDDDDDLWRWLESACADAAAGSVGELSPAAANDVHNPPERDAAIHADIPALCELAGWPARPRGNSDETQVDLLTRDGRMCHATAAVEGAAVRFRIALELETRGETSPACLAAIVVALLRIAGGVRLVRATLSHTDASLVAVLDVRMQPPFGSETLNHALSCLAVAHQQVAAELDVLAGDDALASAYLALQGVR
jgi:hypothetical protein